MKYKQFLTIEEQIHYLEKQKNISFFDKDFASTFLLKNNYYNVISAAKIFFCSGFNKEANKHIYLPSTFDEWIDFYLSDQNISFLAFKHSCLMEKEINSKLAYYISKFIAEGLFNQKEKAMIKRFINTSRFSLKNKLNYDLHNTWVFITNFTFGETIHFIKQLRKLKRYRETNNLNFRELNDLINLITSLSNQQLESLLELRNYNGHNIPLTVFLAHGNNTKLVKSRINILKKALNIDTLDETNQNFIRELEYSVLKYVELRQ